MSGQPETKEQDLLDTILDYFQKGATPDAEELETLKHEIGRLPIGDRAYVYAWLNGMLGHHADAVRLFKDAMNSDPSVVQNYLAYLSRSAHNLEHRMELFRLVEQFPSDDMRLVARNAAFCIGNEKLVKQFSLKLAALRDGEEREDIINQGKYMAELIIDFKKATNLSSRDIEILCDHAEDIANKRGINCTGVSYYMGGDEDNAFIVRAQTDDSQVLAEMNMELLVLLTDDCYRNIPFTSWFQSDEKRGIY
ncbi:hypothetical protein EKN54_12500 [Enterobacter hormaechei]|uniref:hypothetical protein n=1 Tax=Enterobacter hormaechei TaxID=158836 RepID=UPI000F892459|nr:hypothetical protein [Enterobacter hormaechei]RTO88141.1 hypothetical protein EKN54_12500 [Enterobacter hormaechei]